MFTDFEIKEIIQSLEMNGIKSLEELNKSFLLAEECQKTFKNEKDALAILGFIKFFWVDDLQLTNEQIIKEIERIYHLRTNRSSNAGRPKKYRKELASIENNLEGYNQTKNTEYIKEALISFRKAKRQLKKSTLTKFYKELRDLKIYATIKLIDLNYDISYFPNGNNFLAEKGKSEMVDTINLDFNSDIKINTDSDKRITIKDLIT